MTRVAQILSQISIRESIPWERLLPAFIVFITGFILIRFFARIAVRTVARPLKEQSKVLLRKILVYLGSALLLILVLNAAGVSVGGLLGAAGVIGIAVGIASQASLSNIISGLFLLSERFFELGDVVTIGEYTGTVYAVDLLSVKIRKFDNLLIRIPNQTILDSNLVNITRFPIRRMDFVVVVPFDEPVARVLDALRAVSEHSKSSLESPEPLVMFKSYEERGLSFLLGVWFERELYVDVRNEIAESIQRQFTECGIRMEILAVRLEDGAKKGTLLS